jgi:AraC-like DNA-binding protein
MRSFHIGLCAAQVRLSRRSEVIAERATLPWEEAMDLFVLHRDATIATGLVQKLEGRQVGAYRCSARQLSGWAALRRALDESGMASAVLLEARFGLRAGDERRLHPEVPVLMSEFPTTAFLVLMRVSPDTIEDVAEMGRLGMSGVIAVGHNDTPAGIARALGDSLVRKFRAALVELGLDAVPGHGPAILGAAATTTVENADVPRMAEILQVSVPTLGRWCRASGLPPPGRLLAWGRILMAANLLDNSGRSIASVAAAVGYSADSGLRRIFAQFLDEAPSELRERGAFETAKGRFMASLGAS